MADNTGSKLQSEVENIPAISESAQQIPNRRKRPSNSNVVPQRNQRRRRGKFILEDLPVSTVEEEEDELQYMTIQEVGRRKSLKFGYDEKMYVLSLKDEIALNPPADWDWMTLAVNGMRRYAVRSMQYQRGDKINVVVENPKFNNPVSTGYEWTGDTAAKLVNKIRDIITSDTSVQLKDCLFRVIVVKMPRGSGPPEITNSAEDECTKQCTVKKPGVSSRSKMINLAEDKLTKRCIIQIKNRDNLCCPRAIITGK